MSTAPERRPMRRGEAARSLKVVVTGPFAAGKTTFIRTISEIDVLSTERGITDATAARKGETTVAMDFGRICVDEDLVLYLFGTPGQDRFEFMWDILGSGMLGFVLVVDASRPEGLQEAAGILTAFRAMSAAPFVVAMNRAGSLDAGQQHRIRDRLALAPEVPVVGCDATCRDSVKTVLLALLHTLLETLDPVAAV